MVPAAGGGGVDAPAVPARPAPPSTALTTARLIQRRSNLIMPPRVTRLVCGRERTRRGGGCPGRLPTRRSPSGLRERQHHPRTAEVGPVERDRAAVALGDHPHDRETQTGAVESRIRSLVPGDPSERDERVVDNRV